MAKGILLIIPGTADVISNSLSTSKNPVELMIFGSALPSIAIGFLLFSNVETLLLKCIGCKSKVVEQEKQIMVFSYDSNYEKEEDNENI